MPTIAPSYGLAFSTCSVKLDANQHGDADAVYKLLHAGQTRLPPMNVSALKREAKELFGNDEQHASKESAAAEADKEEGEIARAAAGLLKAVRSRQRPRGEEEDNAAVVAPARPEKRARSGGEIPGIQSSLTMQLGVLQWQRMVSPQFLSVCQDVCMLVDQSSGKVMAGSRLEPLLQRLGDSNMEVGMRLLVMHLQQHLPNAISDQPYKYDDCLTQANSMQMGVSGTMLLIEGSTNVLCSLKDVTQVMQLTNLCNMLMASSAGSTVPPPMPAAGPAKRGNEIVYHTYDAFSFN